MRRQPTILATAIALLLTALAAAEPPVLVPPPLIPPSKPTVEPPASTPGKATADDEPRLRDAPKLERQTLDKLRGDANWVRRSLAALRLQRFKCDDSRLILEGLVDDRDWHVRAFALLGLATRGEAQQPRWLETETEPRVIRSALRCRYELDPERLQAGVAALAESRNLDRKMLAVEIALASGDEPLVETAKECIRSIILRMDRVEGGLLSPRLALVTSAPDLRRHYKWKSWYRKHRGELGLRPVLLYDDGDPLPDVARIAQLDTEQFAALEGYMEELSSRKVDLAICIDCTASMWAVLGEAQGGIDDLMHFAGDVVDTIRVGIVAYRDRRNDFETKGWDFTSSIDEARSHLWQLNADEGGDERELVHKALRIAYADMTWNPDHERLLVLIGDAPPHLGHGGECVAMAAAAARNELTTHVIQARGEEVKHFPEIAAAGGGRCLALDERDSLIAEVTGLTIGERFEEELAEFFELYLVLCR